MIFLENNQNSVNFSGPPVMALCGTSNLFLQSETNEIIVNFVTFKQPIYSRNRNFVLKYQSTFQSKYLLAVEFLNFIYIWRVFNLFFLVVCGGNLNFPSGIITSVGYPRTMASHCRWKIAVAEDRRITLNILDLDFEKPMNFSLPQRLTVSHSIVAVSFYR